VTESRRAVLGLGDDFVRTLMSHAHDVLPGHQTIRLLLGVQDEPLGLLPPLGQDLIRVGDDLLGTTDGGGDGMARAVDQGQRIVPIDDGGGAHRHGARTGDELVELVEDAQQVVSGVTAGRHEWFLPVGRLSGGAAPAGRP